MSKERFGEWIPVTQKTPKDFEWVLVWYHDKKQNAEGCTFAYQVEDIWHLVGGTDRTVLAWMPKPKNYEGGDSDGTRRKAD